MDDELDELFGELPAIAIEGAKGTGKTSTASQRVESVLSLDDAAVRSLVASDPAAALRRHSSVLVDEWQLLPEIWDAVRRAVDDNPRGGRFLLTGSATLPPGTRIHSGAGRIVGLRMRPMTLPERGVTTPLVSLGDLGHGRGRTLPLPSMESKLGIEDYVREILASGLPGIRGFTAQARALQLDGYVSRILEHEIPEAGATVRRPAALRSWLTAYAAATSTTASYTAILDAATPNHGVKPSRVTADYYREILTRLWVLDPLPAWSPTLSHLRRLGMASKHHLVDPALAAALLDASEESLLGQPGWTLSPRADATLLGALFESLATLSVRVFAQRHGWRVSHLRTRNGDHEIDLIVEVEGLRVLAIEVKLAGAVDDSDVTHLRWLSQQLGDRVVDSVVLTTGPFAYRRRDGVAVIPLGMLGA